MSVLDLRDGASRDAVGLTLAELTSEVGDYEACHRIGQAAYELGLHGVIAPSAGGLGETLAAFEDHLPESEQPSLVEEQTWESLPPDPRAQER
jgi:hypothetical protein